TASSSSGGHTWTPLLFSSATTWAARSQHCRQGLRWAAAISASSWSAWPVNRRIIADCERCRSIRLSPFEFAGRKVYPKTKGGSGSTLPPPALLGPTVRIPPAADVRAGLAASRIDPVWVPLVADIRCRRQCDLDQA